VAELVRVANQGAQGGFVDADQGTGARDEVKVCDQERHCLLVGVIFGMASRKWQGAALGLREARMLAAGGAQLSCISGAFQTSSTRSEELDRRLHQGTPKYALSTSMGYVPCYCTAQTRLAGHCHLALPG
jgi:hypothetical protein